eukprot:1351140-Amorphochlora_amoeboformis.AAC.3
MERSYSGWNLVECVDGAGRHCVGLVEYADGRQGVVVLDSYAETLSGSMAPGRHCVDSLSVPMAPGRHRVGLICRNVDLRDSTGTSLCWIHSQMQSIIADTQASAMDSLGV